jgi:hypothetical protein
MRRIDEYSEEQLRAAARGMAYRAEQLALSAVILSTRGSLGAVALDHRQTIQNALIESALAHSRSLAEFFMDHPKYVRSSMFSGVTGSELPSALVGRIYGMASEHLGHTKVMAADGDPDAHPGAWPVPELAILLTGALTKLVATLPPERAAWFTPPPMWAYECVRVLAGGERPPVSEHEDVGALTLSLRAYLDGLRGERGQD